MFMSFSRLPYLKGASAMISAILISDLLLGGFIEFRLLLEQTQLHNSKIFTGLSLTMLVNIYVVAALVPNGSTEHTTLDTAEICSSVYKTFQ